MLELILLGLGVGFLAGLLGIGGGMVLVPFLTYFLGKVGTAPDLAVKMAIATAMATVVFTSISSLHAHHRRGAVRWAVVRSLAPGIVCGGLLASLGAFSLLRGQYLALFFALFVGFSAWRMLRTRRSVPAARALPGRWGLAGAGAALGFIAGLVGAGGAFISVPLMNRWSLPMPQAVGTSAALGLPVALVNTAGFAFASVSGAGRPAYSLGYLWLPALLGIACCSMLTAPWGARMAHRLPVHQLKLIFALLLFALAGYMLYQGLYPMF